MRGKLLDGSVGLALQRLIPAHTGKTGRARRRPSARWAHPRSHGKTRWSGRAGGSRRAHPRSRGENNDGTGGGAGMLGSSPLTRGKRAPSGDTGQRPGLIPAHAGKTGSRSCRLRPSTAHPHSCGENVRLPSALRGAGLIPAHAGKTSCSSPSRPSTRAHPRSRGENVTVLPQQSAQPGSSPLTQGKHLVASARHAIEGLIPAHAGKTAHPKIGLSSSTAHPRSRGENRLCGDARRLGARLIPAHAGKTALPIARVG